MRVAIFDCPMGIAGDMTLGAFLDAGMPFEVLKKEIAKLGLHGYKLNLREVRSGAFRAKKFSVEVFHHASHHHTPLSEIEKKIRDSKLAVPVKKRAVAIFRNLGKAEARVHGVGIQKVHFHEIGAVDSLIDIVGAAVCFDYLKIRKAYVRHIAVGRGIQKGSHGAMPIPVPGAYELLKGFFLTQALHEHEMVTPTGAAILTTCCEKTQKIPRVKIEAIGYGAGDKKFKGKPGLLRVSLASAA